MRVSPEWATPFSMVHSGTLVPTTGLLHSVDKFLEVPKADVPAFPLPRATFGDIPLSAEDSLGSRRRIPERDECYGSSTRRRGCPRFYFLKATASQLLDELVPILSSLTVSSSAGRGNFSSSSAGRGNCEEQCREKKNRCRDFHVSGFLLVSHQHVQALIMRAGGFCLTLSCSQVLGSTTDFDAPSQSH